MRMKLTGLMVLLLALLSLIAGVEAQGSLTVQVRYADAVPFTDTAGYTVNAYVSVMDSEGIPLKGLTGNSFRIYEDSNAQKLKDVQPANDEPISLVLLMDMSGSMLGQSSYDPGAAAQFLGKLSSYDRSAVMSFNETLTTLHRFTTDHSASANASLLSSPENGKGSCLYDSLYSAMEMTLSEGEGRKAVILFTDGIDELADGSKCSIRSLDDVLNFSAQNHIQIYTMGIGTRTDDNELRRIGETSGGSFIRVSDAVPMNAAFTRIYDRMVNEYKLVYESFATAGSHTLLVAAERAGIPGQGSYTFTFPVLPTIMRFNSPFENGTAGRNAVLSVAFISQSAEIGSVEYYENGNFLGKTVSYPYELSWDTSALEPGTVTVEAVAYGRDGRELARRSMITTITDAPTEEPVPTDVPTETPFPEPTATALPAAGKETKSGEVSPVLIAALVIIAAGVVIWFIRFKKEPEEAEPSPLPASNPDPRGGDGGQPAGSILAVLEVKNSDERAFIGSRFYVTRLPLTLGRSTDNDVVFSQKDTAVGRHHAILEERAGQITIRDLNSRYGTFVNGRKLGEFPITLENGSDIRLGSRALLHYTRTGSFINGSGEAATVDKLELLGSQPAPQTPAETVKTTKLSDPSGDETVRVSLVGGKPGGPSGDGQ